jgi:hypothetical protein
MSLERLGNALSLSLLLHAISAALVLAHRLLSRLVPLLEMQCVLSHIPFQKLDIRLMPDVYWTCVFRGGRQCSWDEAVKAVLNLAKGTTPKSPEQLHACICW